jgi:hypothetical protein
MLRAWVALLIWALLCVGEGVSALGSLASNLNGQGLDLAKQVPLLGQNHNRKLKPLHEADLQRLFPEADQPQISPLAEIVGQISQKLAAAKKSMTYKTVTKVLPLLEWLPPCIRSDWKRYLFKAVSAGIVVGIMLVPQAIAYSLVASLPPQYG